jgi:hypothetical protein
VNEGFHCTSSGGPKTKSDVTFCSGRVQELA